MRLLNSKSARIVIVISILFFAIFVGANTVVAANQLSDWSSQLKSSLDKTGGIYQTSASTDNANTLATYIGSIMLIIPFISVIFLIQLVIAGYQWMSAAGSKEKVEAARKRIIFATIGIIILATAYLISYFVVSKLGAITQYQITTSQTGAGAAPA